MNKPNHVMVRQDEPKSTKAYPTHVGADASVRPNAIKAHPNHVGVRLDEPAGITLVALIVTIGVMVILAGVAINVSSNMQAEARYQEFKTKLDILQTEVVEKYGNAGTSSYVQDGLMLHYDGIDNTRKRT